MSTTRVKLLAFIFGVWAIPAPGNAAPDTNAALVRSYCSGCHVERGPGQFDRISNIRKTPEGWVMTLFRMQNVHGLVLPDDAHDSIVRYLADAQGLAPSEAAPARYALERRPNVTDLDRGPELATMCGRCHSMARSALQRRDATEWLKLAHTHLGQWPSLEYQASSRDRPWWEIASKKLPSELAALYPYASTAWTEWQARPRAALSGHWVVVGRVPGRRDFYGTAEISRASDGSYAAQYALTDVAGAPLAGDSHAVVYTGYEWRGRATVGGRSVREVYAMSEDGRRLTGRWFDAEHSEEGGEWTAVRADAPPEILAVLPQALRAGTYGRVAIVGTGLQGATAPSFGAGSKVTVTRRDANIVEAEVAIDAAAVAGARTAEVGTATATLAVYHTIDRLDVKPAFGIARVGGGKLAPVVAQFEAIGATHLPSGEWLTLGPLVAEWSAAPFDADAKRTADDKYAGRIESNGRFVPAGAGPNPEREYSGNNIGNLNIIARVKDAERTIESKSHLIVTVQRWNTPPIY